MNARALYLCICSSRAHHGASNADFGSFAELFNREVAFLPQKIHKRFKEELAGRPAQRSGLARRPRAISDVWDVAVQQTSKRRNFSVRFRVSHFALGSHFSLLPVPELGRLPLAKHFRGKVLPKPASQRYLLGQWKEPFGLRRGEMFLM